MAIKIVNDDSLTDVANAIRLKAEISGTLEFPDGFVSAIENIPAGGVSNVVTGTFVVTAEEGSTQNVDIPYTGAGYPIAFLVYVSDGLHSPNTQWATVVKQYAIGVYCAVKGYMDIEPDYMGGSGTNDKGDVACIYKTSASSVKAISYAGKIDATIYHTGVSGNYGDCVRMIAQKKLQFKVANGSSRGLQKGEGAI